jgi:hypothetical protein
MAWQRVTWWIVALAVLAPIPGLMFWAPTLVAPLLIPVSLGCALIGGYLIAVGRRWSALAAVIASQLVVVFTYAVELPGYWSYPWLLERGSRTSANQIAWGVWLVICLGIGAVGFAWGRGRRAMLALVAGWWLIAIGAVGGVFTFIMIAAGAGYAGVDPGIYLLLAPLVPALPIVPGVLLLLIAHRVKTNAHQSETGQPTQRPQRTAPTTDASPH